MFPFARDPFWVPTFDPQLCLFIDLFGPGFFRISLQDMADVFKEEALDGARPIGAVLGVRAEADCNPLRAGGGLPTASWNQRIPQKRPFV